MLLSSPVSFNRFTWILLISICQLGESKDITTEMREGLKAWCNVFKGTHAYAATKACCTKDLGTCFLPLTDNDDYLHYCLVKSNSKENSEKVKQCCATKKAKRGTITGKDGYKVGLGTMHYKDCP